MTANENKNHKLLDLGCGIRKRPGAVGVDIVPNPNVDIIHDLNKFPYPFENNSFDDIYLDNSIEHLNDLIKVMEEIHRISMPGAKITIRVPYFGCHFAIDPTHKQYFCYHSFFYFDPTHEYHKFYKYSQTALFKVEKVIFDEGYEYGFFNSLRFGLFRSIANKYPLRYEDYLGHIFPLHSITFYLATIKN